MKRAFLVFAISIIVLLSFAPNIFRVSAASGLADTINSVANGVNWSDGDFFIQHTGYLFSRVTSPNYVLTYPYADSAYLFAEARLSQVDGTGSPTTYVTSSWPRCAGADQLPLVGSTGDWLIYYRWAYHLYDWFPASWSRGTALTQFRAAVAGSPMLDYPGRTLGSNRYYDEYIETADIYLGLGSVSDAVSTFVLDANTHWNGQYWGYTSTGGIECESGPFTMICAKIYVANGNSLPAPGLSAVYQDLVYKFLSNGWNSPLWNGKFVCTHASDSRLRLQNTVDAWAALQMYWTYFTSTQKAAMVSLLTGDGGTTAWQHLMQSALYDPASGKFKMFDGPPEAPPGITPMDAWTAKALPGMLLMGIVPDTGSLAIPLTEEFYEDSATWMPATNFGFNYANEQIKIPVRAGTLHFLFGTTETSAQFPTDGIYVVQFANGWNTVSSVNQVGSLTGFPYLPVSGGSPPIQGTLSLSATYNGNSVAATVTITGPTNTVVTTPASPTVTAGTYTLTAHYDSLADQTLGNVVVSAGGQITIAFPFTNTPPTKGTLRIFAKYNGAYVAVQVTVTGSGFSQTGTTTTDPQSPLSYTQLTPESYQVSGTYQGSSVSKPFVVQAGSTPTDAILDFGGGDWIQWLMHNPIVIVVGVAAVGIIGGGTAIGLRQTMPQPKQLGRKRRRRR